MNKKGQIPGGVLPILGVIFFLFIIGTVIIPQLSKAFNVANCGDEKQEIITLNNKLNSLSQDNNYLQNELNQCILDLNESKTDCLKKLNEYSNKCEGKIQNITQNFNYSVYIKKTITFLSLFTLQLFLIIPITFSLFKFVFSVKPSKEGEKIINFIKLIMIIVLSIILVIYTNNFFNSLKTFFQ